MADLFFISRWYLSGKKRGVDQSVRRYVGTSLFVSSNILGLTRSHTTQEREAEFQLTSSGDQARPDRRQLRQHRLQPKGLLGYHDPCSVLNILYVFI